MIRGTSPDRFTNHVNNTNNHIVEEEKDSELSNYSPP